MYINRESILQRLQSAVEKHIPIIGAGAGTGLSAISEEEGGADLLVIYNSGRYRMQGRPSCYGRLPYGDANAIMLEMANLVLPVVKNVPVLAGINANDPFRNLQSLLKDVKEIGFSGVQNFPSIVAYDDSIGQMLKENGISYDKEIEMVKIAHDLDLLTTPYVYTPEQAIKMTQAGADILVVHCEMTVGGMDAPKAEEAMSLDSACQIVQVVHDAAVQERNDVIVVCHGGPIAMPEDVRYVLTHTKGIVGFWAASSAERIPTEIAIKTKVQEFKKILL